MIKTIWYSPLFLKLIRIVVDMNDFNGGIKVNAKIKVIFCDILMFWKLR